MFRPFDAHRRPWLSSPHRRWPFAPSSAHHYHIHKIAFTRFEAHTRHSRKSLLRHSQFSLNKRWDAMRLITVIIISLHALLICCMNGRYTHTHRILPTVMRPGARYAELNVYLFKMNYGERCVASGDAHCSLWPTPHAIHPFGSHETSATVWLANSVIYSNENITYFFTFAIWHGRVLARDTRATIFQPVFEQNECWTRRYTRNSPLLLRCSASGFSHCRRCHGSPTSPLLLGVKIKFFRLHLQCGGLAPPTRMKTATTRRWQGTMWFNGARRSSTAERTQSIHIALHIRVNSSVTCVGSISTKCES